MEHDRPRHLFGDAASRQLAAGLGCVLAFATVLVGGSPAHADGWRDKQWYLSFLRIEKVHKITEGKGVTVAVIDTGVDGNHSDLAGNVLEGIDYVDASENGWKDAVGHGTGMASIIAGHGHGPSNSEGILGLAPQSSVLPVRVLPPDAKDDVSYDDEHVDDGLTWATAHGADVLNLSLSGGGLDFALEDAFKSDVVVVAAAGNTTQKSYKVRSPAGVPGVVAVSGLDEHGTFAKESAQGPEVVLSAPAVNLAVAGAGEWGKYFVGTGTSGATAIVSATAALIRAKYPDISANGVINRLVSTADDKGPPGRDPKYGFGVVNPLRALTADIPDIDYNPLVKGTPGPTISPSRAGSSMSDGSGNSDVGLILALVGGLIALVIIAIGAILFTRSRRTGSGR